MRVRSAMDQLESEKAQRALEEERQRLEIEALKKEKKEREVRWHARCTR